MAPNSLPSNLLLVVGVDNRVNVPGQILGHKDTGQGAATLERSAELKGIVFAGLVSAVEDGLPKSQTGVWADPDVGEAVLLRGRAMSMTTVVSVERPGHTEFQFENAAGFTDQLKNLDATFAGARVRYNPANDGSANESRRNLLRRLSEIFRTLEQSLLIELIVRPNKDEVDAAGGFLRWETEIRPVALLQAICELQDAGVEPDIWAIEPPLESTAAATVAAQVHVDDRTSTGMLFVVANDPTVVPDDPTHLEIVRLAARTPGVTGLLVGPGAYCDTLTLYHKGIIDRDTAVGHISSNVRAFTSIFTDAKHRSSVS